MISLLGLGPAAESLSGPDGQRADLPVVDNIDVLVGADVLVGGGGEEVMEGVGSSLMLARMREWLSMRASSCLFASSMSYCVFASSPPKPMAF
jgi:hypothetical protein